MNDEKIESLLRKAPQPNPPGNLHDRLLKDVPGKGDPSIASSRPQWNQGGWLRRWLPGLAYALAMLICLAILAVQTSQISEIRRENEQLRASTAKLAQLREENAELQKLSAEAGEVERLLQTQKDMSRLREESAKLKGQMADMPALQAENQRLKETRQAIAQNAEGAEEDPLAEARERARTIQCVNNLKQICLAARIYATDNHDMFPASMMVMSNELGTPKILVCPSDEAKTALTGRGKNVWADLTDKNISYEYLAPGISDTNNHEIIVFRCPIHGSVGLLDGSVHGTRDGTNVLSTLEERNGYYYLKSVRR